MKLLCILFLISILILPVSALEIEAPEVPNSGYEIMPDQTDSFLDAVLDLLQNALEKLAPDLSEAVNTGILIFVMIVSVSALRFVGDSGDGLPNMVAVLAISAFLFGNTDTMLQLSGRTISELCEYGRLLFPVMTTALAAQGGVSASGAFYAATVMINAGFSQLCVSILVPGIYLYLALGIASAVTDETFLKRMQALLKSFVTWTLKTALTIFLSYMSITGVVNGTTDAAALKAAKITISSAVPVVGGILSEASEAVLVSAGMMKNAAGIYGIVAILAVFLLPFLRIFLQNLLLKAVAAVSSVFAAGRITEILDDFSTALGLSLAIVGSMCLLLLISTVCFMRGVG